MTVERRAVSMVELVRYEVADDVATVTLNDPERRNPWSVAMERQYVAALERATEDRDVRVIVVTGAGGNFCPGPDAQELADVAAGADDELIGQFPLHYALRVPKPMIAAIEGLCAGIGLLQALLCDVRFVADGARVSTAYARRGLPAEHGTAWLLPRLIGVERALDLLLSARTLDADEAVAMGVATRRSSSGTALPDALDYAREIATRCSPRSTAAIRRQVWGDLDRGYAVAMNAAESVTARFNDDNTDFAEGVASFVERRPPRFAPLDPGMPLPSLGLFDAS